MIFTHGKQTHLYLLNLSDLAAAEGSEAAISLLCAAEKVAYERIKVAGRRREYLFGRYAAKMILARYMRMHARDLVFQADKFGKPHIVSPQCPLKLAFNIAHSGDLLAIAVCRQGEIGVDVEQVCNHEAYEVEDIANRHFAPAEQSLLAETPKLTKVREFFRMWTLKEAILKAIGAGLNIPLKEIDVAATNKCYRILWRNEGETSTIEALHWDTLESGYHVAVACFGNLGKLTIFNSINSDDCCPQQ